MNHTRTAVLALIVLLCAWPGLSHANQNRARSESALAVTIRAVETEVAAGTAVRIVATATNTSDKTIPFWQENAQDQGGVVYRVEVENAKGESAPDTKLGARFKRQDDAAHISSPEDVRLGSGVELPLKPGEQKDAEINVSLLYDLSSPGKYTIAVRRADSRGNVVKSNAVTVTVTP